MPNEFPFDEVRLDDALSAEGDSDEPAEFVYSIANYGADYPVDGLVKRLSNGDVFVPPFQRKFVWNQKESSRFIESLLLGLPVPGVFLAKDEETQKLMVIDGQQRLQTLKFFVNGIFADSKREFELRGVDKRFEGRTYKTLLDEDRRRLDDSIIHATVVKQEHPSKNQSSIFHIFERINTGGQQLTPQEIRACIYFGPFSTLLAELNELPSWRGIYGPMSNKMRDIELVLRFLAMFFDLSGYSSPMKTFLNDFMSSNRHLERFSVEQVKGIFLNATNIAYTAFGEKPFRLRVALNTAIFDSMMYGIACRLQAGEITNIQALKSAYDTLMRDTIYVDICSKATANEKNLQERMRIAREAFAVVQ